MSIGSPEAAAPSRPEGLDGEKMAGEVLHVLGQVNDALQAIIDSRSHGERPSPSNVSTLIDNFSEQFGMDLAGAIEQLMRNADETTKQTLDSAWQRNQALRAELEALGPAESPTTTAAASHGFEQAAYPQASTATSEGFKPAVFPHVSGSSGGNNDFKPAVFPKA